MSCAQQNGIYARTYLPVDVGVLVRLVDGVGHGARLGLGRDILELSELLLITAHGGELTLGAGGREIVGMQELMGSAAFILRVIYAIGQLEKR